MSGTSQASAAPSGSGLAKPNAVEVQRAVASQALVGSSSASDRTARAQSLAAMDSTSDRSSGQIRKGPFAPVPPGSIGSVAMTTKSTSSPGSASPSSSATMPSVLAPGPITGASWPFPQMRSRATEQEGWTSNGAPPMIPRAPARKSAMDDFLRSYPRPPPRRSPDYVARRAAPNTSMSPSGLAASASESAPARPTRPAWDTQLDIPAVEGFETEILPPPPILPNDPAYPPLAPDAPPEPHVPVGKKKGQNSGATSLTPTSFTPHSGANGSRQMILSVDEQGRVRKGPAIPDGLRAIVDGTFYSLQKPLSKPHKRLPIHREGRPHRVKPLPAQPNTRTNGTPTESGQGNDAVKIKSEPNASPAVPLIPLPEHEHSNDKASTTSPAPRLARSVSELTASDVGGPADGASVASEDTVALEEDVETKGIDEKANLVMRSLDSGIDVASAKGDNRKKRKPMRKDRESAASSDLTESSPAPVGDIIIANSPHGRPARAAGLAGAAASTAFMNSRRRGFKQPEPLATTSTRPSETLLPREAGAIQPSISGSAAPRGSASSILSGSASGPVSPKGAKGASSTILVHPRGVDSADHQEPNNEHCETCAGSGHLLCCEGCTRSFHFACLNPPLDIDEKPATSTPNGVATNASTDEAWYCNVCRALRRGKQRKAKGLFGSLLQKLDSENPSDFVLPADIRGHFKGVTAHPDGSYLNAALVRPLRITKAGIIDERDPYKLKDKQGALVLCYHCKGSAMPEDRDALLHAHIDARESAKTASPQRLKRRAGSSHHLVEAPSHSAKAPRVASEAKAEALRAVPFEVVAALANNQGKGDAEGWRRIVSCDFCPLHWHLDCVDPPLISMPHETRKWMCPNHVDQATPPPRVPKNTAAQQQVVDLPVPSAASIGPGRHYRTRVRNSGLIDIIPDPLDDIFDPSSGKRRSSNAWMLDDVDVDEDDEVDKLGHKVKLRIPERVILLDFWQRARHDRALLQGTRDKHTVLADSGLQMLAEIAKQELPPPALKYQSAIEALSSPVPRTDAQESSVRSTPQAVPAPFCKEMAQAVMTLQRNRNSRGEHERSESPLTDIDDGAAVKQSAPLVRDSNSAVDRLTNGESSKVEWTAGRGLRINGLGAVMGDGLEEMLEAAGFGERSSAKSSDVPPSTPQRSTPRRAAGAAAAAALITTPSHDRHVPHKRKLINGDLSGDSVASTPQRGLAKRSKRNHDGAAAPLDGFAHQEVQVSPPLGKDQQVQTLISRGTDQQVQASPVGAAALDAKVSPEEIHSLLAVRELMRHKGKEEILRFLRS
ncbi:PHD Zn-finger protein [Ceraceosorus bombacis]|uniref:PHD Zn-finger protein n=1 Tax=Ceraceosorus bombacis TaxID=401625 RepID=A0A0P1BE25_9BASI|nr:PHD Zn-finger protein [Ceraceosorus bombacis]